MDTKSTCPLPLLHPRAMGGPWPTRPGSPPSLSAGPKGAALAPKPRWPPTKLIKINYLNKYFFSKIIPEHFLLNNFTGTIPINFN